MLIVASLAYVVAGKRTTRNQTRALLKKFITDTPRFINTKPRNMGLRLSLMRRFRNRNQSGQDYLTRSAGVVMVQAAKDISFDS